MTDGYRPEPGEIVAITIFDDWTPWVLTLVVDADQERAKVALVETTTDDSLTPVPDATIRLLEDSIGDRIRRRRVADGVDCNPEVSKLWLPWDRLDHLHKPGIQGCDRVVPNADSGGETA